MDEIEDLTNSELMQIIQQTLAERFSQGVNDSEERIARLENLLQQKIDSNSRLVSMILVKDRTILELSEYVADLENQG